MIISLSRGRATAGTGMALSPLERESYRQFFMWSLGSHEKLSPVVMPPLGFGSCSLPGETIMDRFALLGFRALVRVFAMVGPPLEFGRFPAPLANRSSLTGSHLLL